MPEITMCPVCGQPGTRIETQHGRDAVDVACENCGEFVLTRTAKTNLPGAITEFAEGPARLSHAIFKMQDGNRQNPIGSTDVKRLIDGTPIPKPHEQADNLIIHLGNRLKGLGDFIPFRYKTLRAAIGAWGDANTEGNVLHLIDALIDRNILRKERHDDFDAQLGLTFEGWERFDQVRRKKIEGKTAFMAMRFKNDVLNRIFQEYFKPAVEKTGFELLRLDERPKAGVIDNFMRARIRTARFLVADLSDGNAGAYWEAGFAEGLDRPVIYTCDKRVFEHPDDKPHFDTNHCHTIPWDEGDPASAAKTLKDTIRATLPSESVPEGDDERRG